MSWALGSDPNWNKRDIGYGVYPARCDAPLCEEIIDRGLAHVCGGEPYGGDRGCGLYFCGKHLYVRDRQMCSRCLAHSRPFPMKPDEPEWVFFKLTDESWEDWRKEQTDLRAFRQIAYPEMEQVK